MAIRSQLHVATGDNTQHNYTYLDHPDTVGNPAAIIFASHNFSPPGRPSAYHDHHVGVWYHVERGRWAVFNQDRADMTPGAAFNLEVLLPGEDWGFVHRATAGNTRGNSTYIDHRHANGKPNAAVLVTPLYTPTSPFGLGSDGVYNNCAIGVWYDHDAERWAIFNQLEGPPIITLGAADMPLGAAFNVEVLSGENYPSFSEHIVFHVADGSNTEGNYTNINFAGGADNNERARLIFTPNYNPRGAGRGTYNNHATGLWYNTDLGKWSIYNEDRSPMPPGAGFNVRE